MADQADTIEMFLAKAKRLKFSRREMERAAKVAEFAAGLPAAGIAAVGERHLSLNVRKKAFAYYLNDHHGDGKVAVWCKSTAARQQELVGRHPGRYFVPAYVGPRGWVGLRLDGARVDWDEVFGLLVEAYRLQAPKRLAAEME